MQPLRSLALVAMSAGLGAALLAGCGSAGSPDTSAPTVAKPAATSTASPSSTPKPSVTGSTSVVPEAVIDVTTQPGSTMGFVGARVDVSQESCEASAGAWVARGVLTNPTKGTVNYRVYVAFLDKTSATRAFIEHDVTGVRAGRAADCAVAYDKPSTTPLTCVLRVERNGS